MTRGTEPSRWRLTFWHDRIHYIYDRDEEHLADAIDAARAQFSADHPEICVACPLAPIISIRAPHSEGVNP